MRFTKFFCLNVLLWFLLCGCYSNRKNNVKDFIPFIDRTFEAYILSKYDFNGNGIIEYDEALRVDTITIFDSVCLKSVADVVHFPNLVDFACYGNHLDRVDFSANVKLKSLWIRHPMFDTLDLRGCKKIENVYCFDGILKVVDLSDCFGLLTFDCTGNDLGKIDLNACRNLQTLHLNDNKLLSLDVSRLRKLKELTFRNNRIQKIELERLLGLLILDCGYNPIQTLDLSPFIKFLYCQHTRMTEVDLRGKDIDVVFCNENITGFKIWVDEGFDGFIDCLIDSTAVFF